MEPLEIDQQLTTNNLHGLIFFTGLDLSGNNAHHNTIFNTFIDAKREKAVQIQYKMLTADNELFDNNRRGSIGHQQVEKPNLPAISRNFGLIKRRWPKKYLEDRPALIVAFVDLDWESAAWFEKRTECESKISSLRQSIGQREIRLALVLIQKQKTSLNDPVAAEKAMEICQHCRIQSRHLFVFPTLSDAKSTFDCVGRLEMAFHEIAQDAYQANFKRIRARNVPNNDQQLLLRQQFKLAFISELREDRHSALRYYKQSYQICAELDMSDIDSFEIWTIASLLNFKICELNFLLSSPLEAINQFRKHSIHFFNREPGVYPSMELAAIEMCWWKSQQCRIFAELFNRAVGNSLAAYASQNPGRFFEEAGSHYKRANSHIRRLRQRLHRTDPHHQRQTPPLSDRNDPLNSFDLNAPTIYLGQRPWRAPPSTIGRASSEPISRPNVPGLAPVMGNPQLIEHAAKLFLERNVRENYAHSIQLYTMAIAQFKRYHCDRFITMAYLDIADESIASRQFAKSIQIFHHISEELSQSAFRNFLRDVLIKAVNSAFCICNLNEWTWALAQLLHSKLWEKNGSMAEEIDEESWMGEAQKFLAGEIRMPFPILQKDSLFSREEIDSARQNWHQMLISQTQQQPFNLDLSKFGTNSFLICQMKFLLIQSTNAEYEMPIVYSGETVPIEVILSNNSHMPFNFNRCSLFLEQNSPLTANKTIVELNKWQNLSKAKTEQINGQQIIQIPSKGGFVRLLFLLKPRFGQVDIEQQQNRAQSPSSSSSKRHEMEILIRRFSLLTANGNFLWEIDSSSTNKDAVSNNGYLAIKVLPQIRKLQLLGPAENKIQLFTDESIECNFTLANKNDAINCEDLRNVRVLCQKVYREEEQMGQPQNTMVQRTFAQSAIGNSPSSAQQSILVDPNNAGHHTLVPVFNQEVATFLGQEESTDFAVRLQSKSNNCVALQIQVCATLSSDGEPMEFVENFPVFCVEPFKVRTEMFCENGENAQCFVGGQRYRILISVEPMNAVNILNVQWKLNVPNIEICAEQPLSEFLTAQFEKLLLTAKQGNGNSKFEEIWIQIPNNAPNDEQLALGDVIIEWKSANSCEPVRTLVNLGQLPFICSPIRIQVELLGIGADSKIQEENCAKKEEEFFEVGRPFGLQFCLWNSLASTQQMPLAIRIGFEQIEGLIFSGIKEDYVTIFPDGEPHKFVQTIIPLSPGELQFPRPNIHCIGTLPGRSSMGLSGEELDRLNRQISTHTFKALPKAIFVMP